MVQPEHFLKSKLFTVSSRKEDCSNQNSLNSTETTGNVIEDTLEKQIVQNPGFIWKYRVESPLKTFLERNIENGIENISRKADRKEDRSNRSFLEKQIVHSS